MPTALVTGATSGIGASFARALAARGLDLVIVARDVARLEAAAASLRSAYGVMVEIVSADLATAEGCGPVEHRLADVDRPIDLLVNSAGHALGRPFLANTVEDEEAMLRVLVDATLRLTHAVLPGMLERGHGAVVNVSSVAGWAAMGTYGAAKSWVTAFTESLARDLGGTGVRVMALCAGYTRTEFYQRAGIPMSRIPRPLWLDVDDVVAAALRDLRAGRVVSVPSVRYKAIAAFLKLAPRTLVRRGGPTR
jgi:short-subunit dehydrogenase